MTNRMRDLFLVLAALGFLRPATSLAAWPEDPPPVVSHSRYPVGGSSYSDRLRPANYRPERQASAEELQTPPPRGQSGYGGAPMPDQYADGGQGFDSYDGGFADGGYYDDGSGGGSCCDSCGSCNNSCCGPIYVRGEYLLWSLKGNNTPALVTTSPSNTPRAQAGVLGQPNTTVLFGDGSLNGNSRSGARVVGGWWIDPCMRIEGEWFILGDQTASFNQSSLGTPILARPFFNLGTGAQDSNVVAFPNQVQGSINVSATSSFQGAGIHASHNILFNDYCGDRCVRLDFLYGFRYLRLHEDLTASSSSVATGTATPVPVGTIFNVADSFTTSNNFYGLSIGGQAEARCCRWYFTSIGRLGIGGTTENVTINGNTSVTNANGSTTTTPGGLLAMPTNIGSFNHNGFTVVPQLELKIGYDITPNARVTVGYDVMYWSRVVRPGEQVDLFVNTSQASGNPLVGTPGPLLPFRESDLWVQGLSVGGEWRF